MYAQGLRRMKAQEVNFDGLVGPTHNYSGLSIGNIASQANAGFTAGPSNIAALLSSSASSSPASASIGRSIAFLIVLGALNDAHRRVPVGYPQRGGQDVGGVGHLLQRDRRVSSPEAAASRPPGTTSPSATISGGESGW